MRLSQKKRTTGQEFLCGQQACHERATVDECNVSPFVPNFGRVFQHQGHQRRHQKDRVSRHTLKTRDMQNLPACGSVSTPGLDRWARAGL